MERDRPPTSQDDHTLEELALDLKRHKQDPYLKQLQGELNDKRSAIRAVVHSISASVNSLSLYRINLEKFNTDEELLKDEEFICNLPKDIKTFNTIKRQSDRASQLIDEEAEIINKLEKVEAEGEEIQEALFHKLTPVERKRAKLNHLQLLLSEKYTQYLEHGEFEKRFSFIKEIPQALSFIDSLIRKAGSYSGNPAYICFGCWSFFYRKSFSNIKTVDCSARCGVQLYFHINKVFGQLEEPIEKRIETIKASILLAGRVLFAGQDYNRLFFVPTIKFDLNSDDVETKGRRKKVSHSCLSAEAEHRSVALQVFCSAVGELEVAEALERLEGEEEELSIEECGPEDANSEEQKRTKRRRRGRVGDSFFSNDEFNFLGNPSRRKRRQVSEEEQPGLPSNSEPGRDISQVLFKTGFQYLVIEKDNGEKIEVQISECKRILLRNGGSRINAEELN